MARLELRKLQDARASDERRPQRVAEREDCGFAEQIIDGADELKERL